MTANGGFTMGMELSVTDPGDPAAEIVQPIPFSIKLLQIFGGRGPEWGRHATFAQVSFVDSSRKERTFMPKNAVSTAPMESPI